MQQLPYPSLASYNKWQHILALYSLLYKCTDTQKMTKEFVRLQLAVRKGNGLHTTQWPIQGVSNSTEWKRTTRRKKIGEHKCTNTTVFLKTLWNVKDLYWKRTTCSPPECCTKQNCSYIFVLKILLIVQDVNASTSRVTVTLSFQRKTKKNPTSVHKYCFCTAVAHSPCCILGTHFQCRTCILWTNKNTCKLLQTYRLRPKELIRQKEKRKLV